MIVARPGAARVLARFVRDTSGATAIEYAMIGAMICTVIVLAVTAISGGLEGSLNDTSEAVVAVTGGGEAPAED